MRSAYGDAAEGGSSGIRVLMDTNVIMLKENPYSALVAERCAMPTAICRGVTCSFLQPAVCGKRRWQRRRQGRRRCCLRVVSREAGCAPAVHS